MSLVDYDAVAGIILKVRRAYEGLDSLASAHDAYMKSDPYDVTIKQNADASEYTWHVKVVKPMRVEWSVILGEIVHNLRSALDQTIYHVYGARNGRYRNGTAFPIFTDPDDFGKYGPDDIRGLGEGLKTFIKALQPYAGHERVHSSLRVLHDFWNQDKHRLVHIWGVGWNVRELIIPPRTYLFPMAQKVIRDEEDVFSLVCSPPNPYLYMQMQGSIAWGVAISHDRGEPVDQPVSLWGTLDDVALVVGSLLRATFDQDASIPIPIGAPRQIALV